MKKQCYIICKDKKNSNVTLINYEKNGFNIKPLNKINYPGIKVNSMIIVNQSFIEKILKKKIKKKLDSFLKLMIAVVEDEDNDPGDISEALNEISGIDWNLVEETQYKSIIVNKYKKYLDEKYITLLLKKINFLEEELKQKLIYVDDLQYEEELKSKKTR